MKTSDLITRTLGPHMPAASLDCAQLHYNVDSVPTAHSHSRWPDTKLFYDHIFPFSALLTVLYLLLQLRHFAGDSSIYESRHGMLSSPN